MHGYMVYWTQVVLDGNMYPYLKKFEMNELTKALAFMETLRNEGHEFVTLVSQNPDHVGKAGASTILPEDYQWSKQYRGVRDPNEPRSLIAPKAAE